MTTKEKILINALKLFEKNGIRNTSLTSIAKSVGITKPAIYNHFSSKEELIKSLYSYCREESKKNSVKSFDDFLSECEEKTVVELLFEIIKSYQNFYANEIGNIFWNMITQEQFFEKDASKIVMEETVLMKSTTKLLFSKLMEKGKLIKMDEKCLNSVSNAFLFIFRGFELTNIILDKNDMQKFPMEELKQTIEILVKPYER